MINTNYCNQQSLNFKSGLTPAVVNKVKNMDKYEYRNIADTLKKKYNIEADVGESNTIAFCLATTVKIMEKAGFKLPAKFSLKPLTERLGEYNDVTDEVNINSNMKDFLDLEKLNKISERNMPKILDHFLSIYLHEFSHAAHIKNIKNFYNDIDYKLIRIMLYIKHPNSTMLDSQRAYLIAKFPKLIRIFAELILPSKLGEYAENDFFEYFAERNTYNLANRLGNNLNIDNIPENYASRFECYPKNWNFESKKSEIECIKQDKTIEKSEQLSNIAKIINLDYKYLYGELFNGNYRNIDNKSLIYNGIGYELN